MYHAPKGNPMFLPRYLSLIDSDPTFYLKVWNSFILLMYIYQTRIIMTLTDFITTTYMERYMRIREHSMELKLEKDTILWLEWILMLNSFNLSLVALLPWVLDAIFEELSSSIWGKKNEEFVMKEEWHKDLGWYCKFSQFQVPFRP